MPTHSPLPLLICSSLAGFLTLPALEAAPKPLRILYLDSAGAEQSAKGMLHNAMRENGRDALYFDYFPSADLLSPELVALYDVALVSGNAPSSKALEPLQKAGRVIPVQAGQSPSEVKKALLGAATPQARKDWESFLAQRETEKREAHPMVANYEKRPEAVTFQHPFTAKGSMERIQVPADMHLELFADAPQIGKPIAMAWDARGRCWVAVTSDYPHGVNPSGPGNDKIIICEDTDGDGRADRFTVFAEGLNIPTGLCFVNGGLMVAQPPHFVFLKDTNGDDKADTREVVFGGMWGIGDTHAQASNLHYGYDNWLYGAVGYSGFKGKVGEEMVDFRQGTYRFRPDGSKLEFLHQFSNNTWAHSANESGDQFGGTANGAPIFYGGLPVRLFPEGMRGMSAKKINVVSEAHAITPNFRQVDVFNGYTAACGSSFVYSSKLPARMQGKALVCEPTMKLVALMDVRPQGAGYTALDGMNVFASSDEWTSPVYAEVGPDGAIWIADWQNFIIQHNPTPSLEKGGFAGKTGPGGAHENDLRDHSRGRIYRVVWNHAKPGKVRPLEGAPVADWVAALDSDTQYWRLTAQRLLVESARPEAVDLLRRVVAANDGRIGAVHALWALHGIGKLDLETHRAALYAKDARLRRNAIRALSKDEPARGLFFGSGVISDADPHTRLAALVKLADFEATTEIRNLLKGLLRDPQIAADEWLKEALRALVKSKGVELYKEGPNLLPNAGFESFGAKGIPEGWRRVDAPVPVESKDAQWGSVGAKAKAHSGEHALRVNSGERASTKLVTEVSLKPNTQYRLSGWAKSPGGTSAVLLGESLRKVASPKLSRSPGWSEVEVFFQSGTKSEALIELSFEGKGEAIFDDLRLSEAVAIEEETLQPGNVARGEKIFRSHASAACVLCHALKGEGSTVGPALDGIAARKDAAYIKQSLLEPNAVLAQGFEYLQVSPMPPMGLLLNPQELADIQAFLQTLK
ncbi:MAG: hypothetical protein RLZZ399_2141 [Verrucomicrobiota bacterium]